MFLREKKSKRKGGTHISLQIVTSHRPRGGTPRQRVLRHIGGALEGEPLLEELRRLAQAELVRALEDAQERLLRRDLERQPTLYPIADLVRQATDARQLPRLRRGPKPKRACVDLHLLREAARLTLGYDEVFGHLYAQAGLNRLWTARHRRSANVFFQAAMMRFLMPGRSKRAHALEMAAQQRAVSLEQIYRMMDHVGDARIAHLQSLLGTAAGDLLAQPAEVLFFDATSLSFAVESEDGLRRKGFSKDGRHHRSQVIFALVMGPGGLALGYREFPGNTADVKTLSKALEDLRAHYGNLRSVLVADAGMLSRDNLARVADAGHGYIVAARLRSLPKALRALACDPQAYGAPDAEGRRRLDLVHDGKRLIVTYDPTRARKHAHDREKAVRRAREDIDAGRLSRRRFVCVRGKAEPALNEEAVREDARFDGLHGVWTSLLDADPADVRERYHDLWAIERAFRVCKSDLAIRPVFHWTPRRIRAHIAICFTAFALLRLLMFRLRVQKAWVEPVSEKTVLDQLAKIQASLVIDEHDGSEYLLPSKPTLLQKATYQMLNLRLPRHMQPLKDRIHPHP